MNPLRLSSSQSTSDPLTIPASAEPGESPFLAGPELPVPDPVPIPIPVTVPGLAAQELPCNRCSELLAMVSPDKEEQRVRAAPPVSSTLLIPGSAVGVQRRRVKMGSRSPKLSIT